MPWRILTAADHDCAVTGSAQIPKKPGDRVKTDRRDALQLARLDRAGELDAIRVPDERPQGVRDHAWKAQTRLYARYRALLRAGKTPRVAIIAIARELVGFIWAIALQTRAGCPTSSR